MDDSIGEPSAHLRKFFGRLASASARQSVNSSICVNNHVNTLVVVVVVVVVVNASIRVKSNDDNLP